MKLFRPMVNVATTGLLALALALPLPTFARDQEHGGTGHPQLSPEKQAQWVQSRLDKAATMLEIKASQEPAWKTFAAANMDLVSSFADRKPFSRDADAATVTRQHADKAAAIAQTLAKLADATEKLQAVLNEDQRKVLDRIVRRQAEMHGMHHRPMHGAWPGREHPHGPAMAPDAPAPSKAPVPANSKN
jgi:hypothetical protein